MRARAGRTIGRVLLTLTTAGALPACGDSSMKMDGDMKLDGTLHGEMKGDLNGTMRIDGPIQMNVQIQGPTIKYQGTYVSDKLLERVDTGKTGTDWLIAVLGEPNSRATLNDGTEIWKWAYLPIEQEASIISVFGGSKDEPKLQPSIAFVRVRDGIAIEKWRD